MLHLQVYMNSSRTLSIGRKALDHPISQEETDEYFKRFKSVRSEGEKSYQRAVGQNETPSKAVEGQDCCSFLKTIYSRHRFDPDP
jgi:hypothetical protein